MSWQLRRQKFEFWIFNGENTLFTKSAQKMVLFQKKITLFFSICRGGVRSDSNMKFSFFSFEPFPIELILFHICLLYFLNHYLRVTAKLLLPPLLVKKSRIVPHIIKDCWDNFSTFLSNPAGSCLDQIQAPVPRMPPTNKSLLYHGGD